MDRSEKPPPGTVRGPPPRTATGPVRSVPGSPWKERLLLAGDGALIYCRWRGKGPAVVLCDGIGCADFAWKHLSPALAAHHRVIHLHLRGHGRSPPPPDPELISIENLADDVVLALDALGEEHAVLMGHSMGVQTSLETYRRHAGRVRAMVLLCGAPGTPLQTLFGTDLPHHLLPLLRFLVRHTRHTSRIAWRWLLPTNLAFRTAVRIEVNGDLIQPEDLVGYLSHLSRVEPELFLRMLGYADQHSAADLLERIRVPVLVVAGRRDGFTPLLLSREMAQRIPRATLVVVPEGTHAAPLERPEMVTQAVERFVLSLT